METTDLHRPDNGASRRRPVPRPMFPNSGRRLFKCRWVYTAQMPPAVSQQRPVTVQMSLGVGQLSPGAVQGGTGVCLTAAVCSLRATGCCGKPRSNCQNSTGSSPAAPMISREDADNIEVPIKVTTDILPPRIVTIVHKQIPTFYCREPLSKRFGEAYAPDKRVLSGRYRLSPPSMCCWVYSSPRATGRYLVQNYR
jgi:hypothetical protein